MGLFDTPRDGGSDLTSTNTATRARYVDPGGLLSGMFQPSPGSDFMGNPDLAQFGANPYSSPLADFLKNMPTYSPMAAATSTFKPDAYKAKDMSAAALPQYDAMRTRLNTQYSQNQSQAQDALDREFAAMGGGPGGAQIKQTENLATGIAKQKGEDLQGIGMQEAQARQDLQREENQKEFQSGETQKGYGFQANQADLARQMQADQFNRQMLQAENQFQFQGGSTIAGLNTSWDQAQAESRNNEFNKQMEQAKQKHSGGILGGGGFLGTGLFNF